MRRRVGDPCKRRLLLVIGPTATATATATTTIAWGTTRTRTFTRTIDVAAIAAGVDQICCGTPARFSNATGKGSAVVAALPLRDLGFGSFGGGRTKNKTGGAGSSSNSSSNPNRPIPCGSAFHPLLNQHGHDPHGHHHRQHGHSHHRRLFSSVFSMPCTGTDFSSGKGTKNGHRRRDATLKVLRVSVENAVRHRLKEDFPREFGVIAVRDDNQERDKQQRELELGGGIHRNNESMSLSSFRTLLALNGFQKVVTPTGTKGRLYLAEGVVATPPRWRTLADEVNNRVAMAFQNAPARDRLFAQPIAISRLHPGDGNENGNGNDNDNDAQNKYKYNSFASSGKGALSASASASSTAASSPQQFSLSVALPEFVQDDLTWYRLAENSAAKFLDRRYSSWKDWTEKRFVLPLRNAKYRTRVMLKTIHKVHQKIHAVLEKSILERCLETIRGKSSSSNDNNNNNNNSNSNNIVNNIGNHGSNEVTAFQPKTGTPLEILREISKSPSFRRYLVVILIMLNVRQIFRHLDSTWPKYMIREFGPDVPKGTIYAINPTLIIILVPIVSAMTAHIDPLVMIHIGSYVSAASVFFLALSTTIWSSCFFVFVLSLGEAIWSPRLNDYTVSVSEEGREGTYMALSSAPLFLAKLPVGILSGVLLQKYCPETLQEGEVRRSRVMWLIIGLLTATSPVVLTCCWKYVSKKHRRPNASDEFGDGVAYTELQTTNTSAPTTTTTTRPADAPRTQII
mmetsp:Transcript_11224/g.23724  ORF Transcript_11224/g.23724 Transcript_11224/m.23724 type:complete len:739 (-) Transcript_11224:1652-3868(-)